MTCNAPSHDSYKSRRLNLLSGYRSQLLFILTSLGFSKAGPIHSIHARQANLEARADTSNGGSFKAYYVVVPLVILAVAVVFFVVARIVKSRRNRTATRPTGNANSREVTAEQLAGGNNSTTNPTTTNAAATRTRRPRRGRRASQMSVTSLPEYMKEPGDQELVIIRGRETPEDESTVIMPDGTMLGHARNDSAYSDLPDTPHDAPLLQNDERDPFRTPSRHAASRASMDTLPSAGSDSLHRAPTNNPPGIDPRGEAPPYFEVVDLSQTPSPRPARQSTQAAQPTDTPAEAADTAAPTVPDSPTPARRSGIRSLFSSRLSFAAPFAGTPSSPPSAAPPDLPEARPSQSSARISHIRDGSRGAVSTHRPSHSGSGSLLSLTPFRTLSRQKSNPSMSGHLTSPSMISLNSISSPLTHTLTRTEFTYPKSGPTPEQLKLISSREAFGKFGVPYGEDAIAYASASRHDLAPPPGFEEVSGQNEASTSTLPAAQNTSPLAVEAEAESPTSSDSSAAHAAEELQSNHVNPADGHEQPVAEPLTASSQDLPEAISDSDDTDSEDEDEDEVEVEAHSQGAPTSATVEPPAPAPAADSAPASTTAAPAEAPAQAIASASGSVGQFGEQQVGASHPPTSFRGLAVPSRPESRASMTSFETAAETIGADDSSEEETGSEDGTEAHATVEAEAPSTPKMRATHTLEPTDATITPPKASASSS